MNDSPLRCYLRMYRRRTGLSQADLAHLLGIVAGTAVSRHESGFRNPPIDVLLAYEVILGAPLRELYEGLAAEVRETVVLRAQGLAKLIERTPCPYRKQKLAYLANLIERDGFMGLPDNHTYIEQQQTTKSTVH